MKTGIAVFGAVTIALYLDWYALQIWKGRKLSQNPASWLMWLVLDGLVLTTTILAGKPIWLPLAYVIGCAPVMVVCLIRGTWKWSKRETFSLVVAALAAYLWQTNGADWGVVAGAVAMTTAGVPLYLDMIDEPDRKSFPIWAITAFACICTLIGSDGTIAGMALAIGSLLYNGSLSFVVLRVKGYQLVEARIVVSTPSFSKEKFFGSGMGVSIEMGKNFGELVFPEIQEEVPASNGLIIMSHDVRKSMTDAENLSRIGGKELFTPNEWTQTLYLGVTRGEKGFFKTTSALNLSYLELKGGMVIAVYARLIPPDNRIWFFGANPLDDRRREDIGRRLFSRSSMKGRQ